MNWYRKSNATQCLISGLLACAQGALMFIFFLVGSQVTAWCSMASMICFLASAITCVIVDKKQLRQALKEDGYGV